MKVKLPENVTVYVGGKKFKNLIPEEFLPEHLKGEKVEKPAKKGEKK